MSGGLCQNDRLRFSDAERGNPVKVRLTPRERQIVDLIAQGCTNREIARRLGTKERTVKNQLTPIYGKYNVTNRLQLAVLAHRKKTES
jgi:DNA-binding CsgD family transcriptional regulator